MLKRAMLGFGSARDDRSARPAELRRRNHSPRNLRFSRRAPSGSFTFSSTAASRTSIGTTTSRCCSAMTASRCRRASHKPKFTFAQTGQLLKSPVQVEAVGPERRMWASICSRRSIEQIDDLCFIKSLHHDNEDHFTAKNMIFTGSGREAAAAARVVARVWAGDDERRTCRRSSRSCRAFPRARPSAFLPAQFGGTAIGRPDERPERPRSGTTSAQTPIGRAAQAR